MKKVLFCLLVALITSSCSKWKDDKVVYYSDDYQHSDMSILGVHSSDIQALWVELSATDKEYDRYTFIAKSNGELHQQTGSIQSDWETSITFIPDNGAAYTGDWIGGKEEYRLTYELEDRRAELTFVYKASGCKK